MSSSEGGHSNLEKISGALKNVQSFLRGKNFPGTARLNRKEAAAAAAAENSESGVAQRGGSSTLQGFGPSDRRAQDGTEDSKGGLTATRSGPIDSTSAYVTWPSPAPSDPSIHSGGTDDSTEEPSTSQTVATASRSHSTVRLNKFQKLMKAKMVNIDALRELAWSGIPPNLRPVCWRLLLGYLPPNSDRQQNVLQRKRREYQSYGTEFYDISNSMRSEEEVGALRQVAVDVPRTAPGVQFFQQPAVQKSLERVLYIWGIRHPASGYVQGINDLLTPFLVVFASEHFDGPMDSWQFESLSEEAILNVEADAYWCICKMLDGIQDHYTSAQPGIQRAVFKVRELVRRIDEHTAQHLDDQGIDFLQFAFRWVNCLLVREIPLHLAIRLWDTYLAEGQKFSEFLVYVCASFLLHWSKEIQQQDFQDMILFLQKLPTTDWTEQQIEVVLSRAYMWRASFEKARSHLY